jgi:hypothetical protein
MRRLPLWFAAILAVSGLCSIALAADPTSPRDELFRLVPQDTTFCVLIQDLRKQTAQADKNSLANQLAKMPFIQQSLESATIPKLKQILDDLKITTDQLRDDILGDAIVFAFRQPAGKKAGQDEGVFLLWARDKDRLAKLIVSINAFQQKKSGELKEVQEAKHKGQVYYHRVKEKDKGPDEYYYLRDNVLAFSGQEDILKQLIETDLEAKPAAQQTPVWSLRYEQIAVEPALFTWMVNPRAFDASLAEEGEKAVGAQQAFLKGFQKYWKAIDGLGFSMNLQKDIELSFAARVQMDKLPKPAQQFFRELGKPSEVWKAIPVDALLALGSRMDIVAFSEMFGDFSDESTRKLLHIGIGSASKQFLSSDNLDQLASGLGPDWGFWMAQPDDKEKTWVPQVGFALKIRDSEAGKNSEQKILEGMNQLSTFFKIGVRGIAIETTKQGQVEIRSIQREQFPKGFKPSYASKQGFLIFASSPSVIEQFDVGKSTPSAKEGEAPVLRISAKSWQEYLQKHSKAVVGQLAQMRPAKDDSLQPKIDTVVEYLKGVDVFEITVRGKPDQGILTFRLKGRPTK